MKIAVPYQNGQVFQHFGHTEAFKVYEAADGAVVSSSLLSAAGSGHGALAGLLRENGVSVLICGGIGEGAKNALREAGVELVAGASGDADAQVAAYLSGALKHDPSVSCSHHGDHGGSGHSCGGHTCGGHTCGGDHTCGGHGQH